MKALLFLVGACLGAVSVAASEPEALYDSLRISLEQVRGRAADYSAKSKNATAFANLAASDIPFRQFVLILAQTYTARTASKRRKADLYGPRNRIPALIDQAVLSLESLSPARCTQDSLFARSGACFGFLVRRLSLKKTDDPNYRPGIFLDDGETFQRKFDPTFEIRVREVPLPRNHDSTDLAPRYFAALLDRGAKLLDEYDARTVDLENDVSGGLRRIARSGFGMQDVEANCFSLLYTNVRDSREATRYMIDSVAYDALDKSFRAAQTHCREAVSRHCGTPTGKSVKAGCAAFCAKAREVGYE